MDFAALVALWIIVAAVLSVFAGGFLLWLQAEWKAMRAKTWAPQSHTTDDPAVQRTLMRLGQARAGMRKNGTKTLYEGREAYWTVNPMAEKKESPEHAVLPFKRRPR